MMGDTPLQKDIARGLAAATVAAALPPTTIALVMGPAMGALVAVVALIIAGAHAVLIGLPTYWLLSRFWPVRWWSATLGGAVVGSVPAAMMVLPEGSLKVWDVIAPLGAVAGFVFWLAAKPRSSAASAPLPRSSRP